MKYNSIGIKIKTKNGFKKFDYINKTTHDEYLEILLENNIKIKCSLDHLFYKKGLVYSACDLKINDYLDLLKGQIKIIDIKHIKDTIELYDIIEVKDGNEYLIESDIRTHNCQFLSFEKAIIDSEFITEYESERDFTYINYAGFRLYKESVNADSSLVITIDPSASGDDNSVIQLWEFTPKKVILIASVAEDNLDASAIFHKILDLQDMIRIKFNKAVEDTILIFERNGIGEGLVQILTQTEKALDELEIPLYYDKKGLPGIYMTQPLKHKAVLNFKTLFEHNKIDINDDEFIEELYGFTQGKDGKYKAKNGYKDDRVMCSMLMVHYLTNDFIEYADGDFSIDNYMIHERKDKKEQDEKDIEEITDDIKEEYDIMPVL